MIGNLTLPASYLLVLLIDLANKQQALLVFLQTSLLVRYFLEPGVVKDR